MAPSTSPARRRPGMDRTLAAECRAVEEGHRAFLEHDAAGPYLRVVSDTTPGLHYRVEATVHTAGEPIVWTCRPSAEGDHHGLLGNVAGRTPCKHMAVAARRLERHGLAVLQLGPLVGTDDTSHWVATPLAAALAPPAPRRRPEPADPFEGFPVF